jgi:hypothetical protein
MGEPCTQLVLRTFHSGGVATSRVNTSSTKGVENEYTKRWGPHKHLMVCKSLDTQKKYIEINY